jgi:hypothetical protein
MPGPAHLSLRASREQELDPRTSMPRDIEAIVKCAAEFGHYTLQLSVPIRCKCARFYARRRALSRDSFERHFKGKRASSFEII